MNDSENFFPIHLTVSSEAKDKNERSMEIIS